MSDGRRVKIGFTTNPDERLRKFQTGYPGMLYFEMLIEGTRQDELAMHKRFAQYRTGTGEWFYVRGELADFLGRNRRPKRPLLSLQNHARLDALEAVFAFLGWLAGT